MLGVSWVVAVVVLGIGQEPKPAVAMAASATADVVTLRDGVVVLGQVLESPDRRAPVPMLVRRAWAAANLPERLAAWEKAEAPANKQAEAFRRARLAAWRRDRPASPAADDRLTPWIDTEIARLAVHSAPGTAPAKSTLIVVPLPRNSIRAVSQRPKQVQRLLRLAWTLDLPAPEAMPLADLTQGLEDRGFAASSEAPVAVDALVPTPAENDGQWAIRRAATELANLPGGRFLLYGGAVIPEPAPGVAPPAGAAMEAVTSTLKDFLGEAKVDPLPAKFADLARQGRGGAVVTTLEMAPDMASVTVTASLWVRPGGERPWARVDTRSATVRPGDLPADAGANLAEDPQVKAAFGVIENLGLGDISPELKRRGLNMGMATQRALGQAREALRIDMTDRTIPLDAPKPAAPAAKP